MIAWIYFNYKSIFLYFIAAKSSKSSSISICLSLSLSMHKMLSADNLSWDIELLNSFFILLRLEKDLSPEQLVTIKVRNSRRIASTLGKAIWMFSLYIIWYKSVWDRWLFYSGLWFFFTYIWKCKSSSVSFRSTSSGYASINSSTPCWISCFDNDRLARKENIFAILFYTVPLLLKLVSSTSSIGIKDFILNLSLEESSSKASGPDALPSFPCRFLFIFILLTVL